MNTITPYECDNFCIGRDHPKCKACWTSDPLQCKLFMEENNMLPRIIDIRYKTLHLNSGETVIVPNPEDFSIGELIKITIEKAEKT